ncbi:hypothetical protein ONS95_013381 [Cadophora gregata]|uniref:uncharacterized protein n=1 Tax=Cadophora gregata TaxID=51156 RepID=UPI0026DB9067|nr:uncharacterized protein ONS95_013381 [Cadophora gregata]KAK0116361.1 hypothetical protein ONS95_013381 [Cadophora gregata]
MPETRDVMVSFSYLQWQELYKHEKPFQIFSQIPPDFPNRRPTNLVFWNAPEEAVKDLRGIEGQFTLDQNGFMVRRQDMPETDLQTEDAVRNEYVPHIEKLLKKEVDGVDFIYCFDWGRRKNAPLQKSRINVNDKMQLLEPWRQVHCDQSPTGALNRLKYHAPDQVNRALAGRLRIINVWRPLYHEVVDNPLALCDGETIDEEDVVEVDHITKLYHGNTMYGLYAPKHKWYYLNHQRPDELHIFKIFDSASGSFHTSFLHRQIPKDAPPRESFEARFLIITDRV